MTYHPDRWQPVIDAVNAQLEILGWDQATFMRRANLSDASVRPFMTGKFRSNPRKMTVSKVEDALGWQRGAVDDIIAGLQPTPVSDEINPPGDATRWTPREQHEALAVDVRDLIVQVQELGAAIDELKRGGRGGARRSRP